MPLSIEKAHGQLRLAVTAAAAAAAERGGLPAAPTGSFNIEAPADRSNGDLSANAAMAWARELKCPPRRIAEAICECIALDGTYFKSCEAAGPGFLNFFFRDEYYADILLDVLNAGTDYGRSDYGGGRRINVEFVSANPTGPMHMGNARGGALGDCLASVLDMAGYEVSREFYVNDAGNQIDKFALSLDIRYLQLFPGGESLELPEDSYHGEDIAARAREFAEINGDSFVTMPEAQRRRALVDYALPRNIDAMRENLAKYRIEYDTWFHESSLYASGELDEIIARLKSLGLTYESDGALWYKAAERGAEKDEVLIRANGNPTYFAADIAYHVNKLERRGFDRAIDIWGADHHGHVARMKGVLDALGIGGDRLDVILMQLVRLTRDGEVVRMSKRTGKAITLVDLLEDIPIDAVRFLFNMREPETQMEFDLDLAVEQSSKNPVYYCQYAHARICSIFKKLAAEGVSERVCSRAELAALTEPFERELILHLAALPDEIVTAAKNYDPAKITRYAVELATLFHKFYNSCRVRCDDEPLMQARLFLCARVRDTLKNILTMFSISVPDSM